MAQAEFRYVTTNLLQPGSSANPIISELPFTGVNFTSQLNSVGTFQGHVLLSGINSETSNAYEGTIPGKTILWVLYTDPVTLVSAPVWSGVIWAREYDSSTQTLGISAQEMMSLYNRRRISVTKDYSVNPSDPKGYDPTYIAQQVMQYAEALPNGKTGLNTTLNVDTTFFRTKKKYEGYELKTAYQAVKDLASQFFDFAIKPQINGNDLVNYLHLKFPLGTLYETTDPYATVFEFPGNLIEYRFPEDASSAANRLYGLGYGNNNTQYVAKAVDPSKIGNYTITNAVASGTEITFTAANRFIVGQEVFVTGVTPTTFNGTYIVSAVTAGATSEDPNVNFKVASVFFDTYTSGGTAKSVWPLLEDSANYIDTGELSLLENLTLGQLNAISYPPTTIELVIPPYIEPIYPSYQVGDQVRLNIKDDYFPNGINFGNNNDPLRIVAISVAPGEEGPSRVTITCTRPLAAGSVE